MKSTEVQIEWIQVYPNSRTATRSVAYWLVSDVLLHIVEHVLSRMLQFVSRSLVCVSWSVQPVVFFACNTSVYFIVFHNVTFWGFKVSEQIYFLNFAYSATKINPHRLRWLVRKLLFYHNLDLLKVGYLMMSRSLSYLFSSKVLPLYNPPDGKTNQIQILLLAIDKCTRKCDTGTYYSGTFAAS